MSNAPAGPADDTADAAPTLRLLGGAYIGGLDGPLSGRVAHRARVALLAVLAGSRTHTASRERIAALLWPESDENRARHLLRETVYRLRESLGHDVLISVGGEIRLDETQIRCDLWEFDTAVERADWETADRLYTGAFLDGFGFGSSEFEHWLDLERARLAAMHARALEALAAQRAAAGDCVGAVELWKRRAAADPFDSRIARRLMEALEATGDRPGALRHATRHAELLRDELATTPDPDVTAYVERLRRDMPAPAIVSFENPNTMSGAATSADGLDPARRSLRALMPLREDAMAASTPLAGFRSALQRAGWPRLTLRTVVLAWALALLGAAVGYRRLLRPTPSVAENRIAILPFRTSGADPALAFLRDGLVDMLSLELNGEIGPTAVDASEALAAWRRAGEPGARSAAAALARELGAGQVTDGFVIGTAARFTITLSVLHTADGRSGGPIKVEGSLDSLPAVVAVLASKLLAPYAGAQVSDVASTSPEVLRLYLNGMVEYRKANWLGASSRMLRAFALDSTFVPAAYQLALIHALVAPTTPFGTRPRRDPRLSRLYGLLWAQRQRLPADHRLLLESVADSMYILWHQQQLPRLERAVALRPNSVEGWELLGDAYYHSGALLGRENWADAAKSALGHALTLDSTIAVNATGHLADIAFMERDARAHARYSRPVHGLRRETLRRYQAAILNGDPTALHTARVEYSHSWARGEEEGADWALQGLTLPPGELDSLLAQMETDASTKQQMEPDASTERQRQVIGRWLADAAAMSGRPARALSAFERAAPGDTLALYEAMVSGAEGDTVAAARLISFALANPTLAPTGHPLGCTGALSHLRRGDSTGVAAILATEPPLDDSRDVISAFAAYRRGVVAMAAICGEVARGVLASLTTTSASRLLRADSLMRRMPLNYADFWNYDLALAFARRGQYALAAAAARRRLNDVEPLPRLALSLRQEGRWAARAGDRAAAIKAYRHYLLWRSAPEQALVPQRDSVQAELAALLKAERRARFWPW